MIYTIGVKSLLFTASVLATVSLSGCSNGSSTPEPPPEPVNLVPIVEISTQSLSLIEGQPFELSGENSTDPENTALTFLWTQTSGPDLGLGVVESETISGSIPEVDADQIFTFELTVSDGEHDVKESIVLTGQRQEPTPMLTPMELGGENDLLTLDIGQSYTGLSTFAKEPYPYACRNKTELSVRTFDPDAQNPFQTSVYNLEIGGVVGDLKRTGPGVTGPFNSDITNYSGRVSLRSSVLDHHATHANIMRTETENKVEIVFPEMQYNDVAYFPSGEVKDIATLSVEKPCRTFTSRIGATSPVPSEFSSSSRDARLGINLFVARRDGGLVGFQNPAAILPSTTEQRDLSDEELDAYHNSDGRFTNENSRVIAETGNFCSPVYSIYDTRGAGYRGDYLRWYFDDAILSLNLYKHDFETLDLELIKSVSLGLPPLSDGKTYSRVGYSQSWSEKLTTNEEPDGRTAYRPYSSGGTTETALLFTSGEYGGEHYLATFDATKFNYIRVTDQSLPEEDSYPSLVADDISLVKLPLQAPPTSMAHVHFTFENEDPIELEREFEDDLVIIGPDSAYAMIKKSSISVEQGENPFVFVRTGLGVTRVGELVLEPRADNVSITSAVFMHESAITAKVLVGNFADKTHNGDDSAAIHTCADLGY